MLCIGGGRKGAPAFAPKDRTRRACRVPPGRSDLFRRPGVDFSVPLCLSLSVSVALTSIQFSAEFATVASFRVVVFCLVGRSAGLGRGGGRAASINDDVGTTTAISILSPDRCASEVCLSVEQRG